LPELAELVIDLQFEVARLRASVRGGAEALAPIGV
jgi:hypothetical protein